MRAAMKKERSRSLMELAADVLHLLLAMTCALFSGLSVGYFGLFTVNILVPVSIDEGAAWHHPPMLTRSPVLNNMILLVFFTLMHSVLSRVWVKDILYMVVPKRLYRQFYVFVASASLLLLCFFWQPIPVPLLWDAASWTPLVRVLTVLGFVFFCAAILSVHPMDFIGVQQPVMKLFNLAPPSDPDPVLVETGMYGLVRHPMYTGLFSVLWAVPKMSLGHLLLSVYMTSYVVLAVKFYEEPCLVETFGSAYLRYKEHIPGFIPFLHWSSKAKKA